MQKPKNIPVDPGVYQFKDKNGEIIYIGKAKNLKNRVTSYFVENLMPKTASMVANATDISFIKVRNEFEALLLEANLVKKYRPKYNIELKDDKSPMYIGITDDEFPRIITFRKKEMGDLKLKNYYGPYLSGIAARGVLRRLRRIFPYSTHLPTKKICLYRQIGLCVPCPSEIANETNSEKRSELKKEYLRNIRSIRRVLDGKLAVLEKDLEKEIKEFSKNEEFEKAKATSDQLKAFINITSQKEYDPEDYLENPNFSEDLRDREKTELKNLISKYVSTEALVRIECFDIAHLAGSFPTASMVTTINGEPEKKFYRHFKIYQKKSNSDVDSMREVITRRLKHLEDWGRPDLIIIDGGKPQLSKVHDLLEAERIPFIGLAKQFETIVVILPDGEFREVRVRGEALKLVQRIRDEAHRFARRLHHKQVSASIRS